MDEILMLIVGWQLEPWWLFDRFLLMTQLNSLENNSFYWESPPNISLVTILSMCALCRLIAGLHYCLSIWERSLQ
jgi:hypothetical protein